MSAATSKRRKTNAPKGNGKKPPPTPELHAPKRAYHREPKYSEDVMDEILRRISHGETLTKACASDPDFPAPPTVIDWVHENRHNLAERYARARDRQLERWADEVVDKADEATPETAHAVRLALDNRKWLLSKLKPQAYGERVEARLADANGEPLQIQATIAVRALLEALPDLGVLPLNGNGAAAVTFNGEPGKLMTSEDEVSP